MFSVIYAAGGDSRNAGFFLRKELGEALRIGQNFKIGVDLSSVASGDTSFLRKEAFELRYAALKTQKQIP